MIASAPLIHPQYSNLDSLGASSPVYVILIIGMVFFMMSNLIPGLLPEPDRVLSVSFHHHLSGSEISHVAPMILQWGFIVIIFALMAQMTGLLPGISTLHLTYVHLTVAFLLFALPCLPTNRLTRRFFLMWNHIAADITITSPSAPSKPSSSSPSFGSSSSSGTKSSSSSSSRLDPKDEKKSSSSSSSTKEVPAEASPSPWEELRAHPSAFLSTKLNRLVPWPFPMGFATPERKELWWESGVPHHVYAYTFMRSTANRRGHFDKPADTEVKTDKPAKAASKEKEKEKDADKDKEKVKSLAEKEKAQDKEKERERAKMQAEKEVAQKATMKEEEAKKAAATAASRPSSSSSSCSSSISSRPPSSETVSTTMRVVDK